MPMAPTMEGDHTRTPSLECEPVKWLGEQFGEVDGEARSLPTRGWLFVPFRQRQEPGQLCTVPLLAGENISMLSAFGAARRMERPPTTGAEP